MSSKIDNKKGKDVSNKKRGNSKSKDDKKKSKDSKSSKSNNSKKDDKIKKPFSAYIFFGIENRARITDENPEVNNKEIMGLIGKEWKQLSDEEKEKYETMAAEDKDRYKQECKDAGISIQTKKKGASSSSNKFN